MSDYAPKFCSQCKHSRRDFPFFWDIRLYRCVRPIELRPNPSDRELNFIYATGKPSKLWAETERIFDLPETCGPIGRYWSPRS